MLPLVVGLLLCAFWALVVRVYLRRVKIGRRRRGSDESVSGAGGKEGEKLIQKGEEKVKRN